MVKPQGHMVENGLHSQYPIKTGSLWNNLTKTDQLSMIFGREDRYLLAEKFDKGWEPRAVTIETLAPLQDSALSESAHSTAEFLHEETPGFVSPELWPLTVQTSTLSISLQNLGLCVTGISWSNRTTGGDLGNGPAEEVTPDSVKAKGQHF